MLRWIDSFRLVADLRVLITSRYGHEPQLAVSKIGHSTFELSGTLQRVRWSKLLGRNVVGILCLLLNTLLTPIINGG